MISPTQRQWLLGLAFATVYVVWGTTYYAIAIALRTLPPFASGSIRFLLAAGLMYMLLRTRGTRPLAGIDWRGAALAGILLTGVGNGFVLWGQQTVPSGIAALLVAALPLWILLFDTVAFSRRRPQAKDIVGSLIGLAGVALIVAQTRSFDGSGSFFPTLMILLAEIAWAIGTLVQRGSVRPGQLGAFACAQMLVGAVFQALCAWLLGEWPLVSVDDFTPSTVIAIAYLTVFGSVVAFNAYLWLVTQVALPAVATYSLVNPVIALGLGAVLLGEPLGWSAVLACLLVLAGVAMVLLRLPVGASASGLKRDCESTT